MILLFSQNQFEFTTDIVYEWIKHLGGNVRRINGKDLLEPNNFKITLSNKEKKVTFKDLDIDDVNIIWYRRWLDSEHIIHNNKEINSYLKKEFYALTQYFFSFFPSEKWYNMHRYFKDFPSKTEQLLAAIDIGFIIPETLITGDKNFLIPFSQEANSVISKPISDIGTFRNKKTGVLEGTFTERISEEYIKNIPENFFPSLFQKEIKKKFEIRVFYNKKVCYSMAIFSNKNEKTEVDFRQYDHFLPNRNVPFQLTENEEKMIVDFMSKIGLETGSLDLIYTLNNEIIFLEVNPIGQFGMVSAPCNYYIEKAIAQHLIDLDYEKKKR